MEQELNIYLRDDEARHVVLAKHQADLTERLHDVIRVAFQRQQRADTAFDLLDGAGKGVVVVQDLQRVAAEFLNDHPDDNDNPVNDDDLLEMMQFADTSTSGDGLLTKSDFYRLARQINL